MKKWYVFSKENGIKLVLKTNNVKKVSDILGRQSKILICNTHKPFDKKLVLALCDRTKRG